MKPDSLADGLLLPYVGRYDSIVRRCFGGWYMEHENPNCCKCRKGELPPVAVRMCPLPEGNDFEHPFSLSIHSAWMLECAIRDYVQQVRQQYENDPEDVVECLLRVQTAIKEAKKLRDWYSQVAPEYLQSNIESVDALVNELNADEEQLGAIARSNKHL